MTTPVKWDASAFSDSGTPVAWDGTRFVEGGPAGAAETWSVSSSTEQQQISSTTYVTVNGLTTTLDLSAPSKADLWATIQVTNEYNGQNIYFAFRVDGGSETGEMSLNVPTLMVAALLTTSFPSLGAGNHSIEIRVRNSNNGNYYWWSRLFTRWLFVRLTPL